MTKKLGLILLIVTVLIVLAFVATTTYRQQASNQPPEWGRGRLAAAEREYYLTCAGRIIENWQRSANFAEGDLTGREEPPNRFLVIDTAKPAVWIENGARIAKRDYSELPKNMQWKIVRSTPQANSELSSPARFKIRGTNTDQILPETIYLIGSGRGVGYLYLNFSSCTRGYGYGSGRFAPQPPTGSPKRDPNNSYGSILVSEAEHESFRRSLVAADSTAHEPDAAISPLATSIQNWLRIQRALYQQIETQVVKGGYDIQGIDVVPGPDYTAGHATVHGTQGSLLSNLFGHPRRVQSYLKIDYIEQDVWYAKTSPEFCDGTKGVLLDLEILVCANATILTAERDEWLAKGRAKQDASPQTPSKWRTTLPNRVAVEFVGICENPSAGKKWWGPDGSPIDYAPYCNAEPYDRPRDDRKLYEIAWRIIWPQDAGVGATESSLEGCLGSYYRQVRDRYGNPMTDSLHADGYAFEKSRKQTTLKVGTKLGGQDYRWIMFKNISLDPGQEPGFKIELEQ